MAPSEYYFFLPRHMAMPLHNPSFHASPTNIPWVCSEIEILMKRAFHQGCHFCVRTFTSQGFATLPTVPTAFSLDAYSPLFSLLYFCPQTVTPTCVADSLCLHSVPLRSLLVSSALSSHSSRPTFLPSLHFLLNEKSGPIRCSLSMDDARRSVGNGSLQRGVIRTACFPFLLLYSLVRTKNKDGDW